MREITPSSTYLPVAGHDLQDLENTAEHLRSILARQLGDATPYTLTVSAPDAAVIAKVPDYLRIDPFIRQIDLRSRTSWGMEDSW